MRKVSKFIAIFCVLALALSCTAFAAAPSAYEDEYNLAVIANGDVYFTQNTLYVRGSIYSNGTIYVDDGGGNFTEGLLISGTGDKTYTLWDGTPVTFGGYQPVNDTNLTDTQITGYSTQMDTNGSVYDADTEATYCGVNAANGSLYAAPDTTGYTVLDSVYKYANDWDADSKITINSNTHFTGSTTIANDALTIDITNNDVTVVIDNLNISGDMPDIQVVGSASGHKAKIYVVDYTSNNNFWIMLNSAGKNNASIWAPPSSYGSVDRAGVTSFDEYLSTVNDWYNECLPYDPNAVELYLSSSDKVTINGSKISANVYIDAPSVEIAGQAISEGNITTNATSFTTTGGASYIKGNICAPYADTDIVNASMVIGQLHTNTLTCNGNGKIVYLPDEGSSEVPSPATPAPATQAPEATATPGTSTDSGIKLNIIEDVVYVVAGNDATFTIDHNTNYYLVANDDEYYSNAGLVYNYTSASDNATINDVRWGGSGNFTGTSWTGSTYSDTSWSLGTVVVKAVSNEDSSVYDTVKIIIVASEADIPSTPVVEAPVSYIVHWDVVNNVWERGTMDTKMHSPARGAGESEIPEYEVLKEGTFKKLGAQYFSDEIINHVTVIYEESDNAFKKQERKGRVSEETGEIYVFQPERFGRIDSNGKEASLSITPYAYAKIANKIGDYGMYLCWGDQEDSVTDVWYVVPEDMRAVPADFSGEIIYE